MTHRTSLFFSALLMIGLGNAYAQPPNLQPQPYLPLPSIEPLERSVDSGTGVGPDIFSIPYLANPGLAGFHFDFHKDNDGDEVDKKIERLLVMSIPDRLVVEYSGTLPDHHPYDWTVERQQLPAGTRNYVATGCDPTGYSLMTDLILSGNEAQGIPVLTGFHFYRGKHHQVSGIKLQLTRFVNREGIYLLTEFSDISVTYGNPPFCYRVNFAIVPEQKVTAVGHLSSGRPATRSEVRSLNATNPVLQGFDLQFVDKDGNIDEHELDEIGVTVRPGMAHVWYNDKNDDDRFNWDIWYADVQEWRQPPMRRPHWR